MQKTLSERMLAFIEQHNLLPKIEGKVLLAVSGGLDSVVMAYLFKEIGVPFAVAHCNFSLRGEESDLDALFVKNLAKQLAVPFHSVVFKTQKEAEKTGKSTQMVARELRYAFFENLLLKNNYIALATAHHRDDSIETALFNFGRGASMRGLRGIPVKNGKTIRPLMPFGKEELREYAIEHGIAWREDSSNSKDDYRRNFIRHQIYPKFLELNPSFSETAGRSLQRLYEDEQNLAALYAVFLENNGQKEGNTLKIVFKHLRKLPSPFALLRHWLLPHGFEEEQLRQMVFSIQNGQSGQEWQSKSDWKLLRERSCFSLIPDQQSAYFEQLIPEQVLMLRLPNGQTFFTIQTSEKQATSDEFEMLADADAVQFPLLLRGWKSGDRFCPLGMEGRSQKLKDFFINQKISKTDKGKTLLLVDAEGEILWVCGLRMAEKAKVKENTTRFLKFRLQ